MRRSEGARRKHIASLLPAELPHSASISDIGPHARDGGGMVSFTFLAPEDPDSARQAAEAVVGAVDAHLAKGGRRRWFGLAPIRALPVRGVPFTEDIVRMLPSKEVKVEFGGPDLTVEQIYREFRRFGRILDIETQPSTSKDTPRWAIVHFTGLREATRARNCAHGDVVGSTKLALSYVKQHAEHVVIQWLREHTKFTIPLAAAALIAIIYAVFDPIREFCVENKITHRFDLSHLPLLGDVRRAAMRSLLRQGAAPKEEASAWVGLAGHSDRLRSLLDDPPESFVVVVGPHGSGKTRMVEQATAGKKYRIVIDAAKIARQTSELGQMTQLAKQLGWWPVFNSIISITNAIDLMVKATTGGNAGISATPESQARRILETLALVLSNMRRRRTDALKAEESRAAKASHSRGDHRLDTGVHTIPSADVPVIVLDSLMDKDLTFAPIILEWAAGVVESGLAHCIVTASSISGYHEVQRAQSQSATSLLSLDDAPPIEAITLLQQQLAPVGTAGGKAEQHVPGAVSDDSIAHAVKVLGGRLEDLQLLVQKVHAGEQVDAALESIIQRAITEVRKHAFDNDAEVSQNKHTWTPEQFWYLLTELAQHGETEYDRVRSSPLFAGSDDALLGLAEAQLITMVYDYDRPSRIRAGRPVCYAAFARIMADAGFASAMTVRMNKRFIELETAKIRKAEEELALLNVFHASADAHAALVTGMAAIAASRGGGGKGAADGLRPEAFVAQAAAAATDDCSVAQPAPKPRSWLGWLFGGGSQNQPGAAQGRSGPGGGDCCASGAQRVAVPGVPHELQGRVRFLLRAIHDSQLKVDQWEDECRARARRLASL
ncbi:mitochondrial escape protein 2 [Coemansia biformis]|uniref:Mitochondrial escape protein 2 n=1 Tax=Coemansia biformis TaxID=1286918 RepID=A0A9W8CXE1_9FUNG|nr:mitochondrial escape protein 2 [Coemansia biformis]